MTAQRTMSRETELGITNVKGNKAIMPVVIWQPSGRFIKKDKIWNYCTTVKLNKQIYWNAGLPIWKYI